MFFYLNRCHVVCRIFFLAIYEVFGENQPYILMGATDSRKSDNDSMSFWESSEFVNADSERSEMADLASEEEEEDEETGHQAGLKSEMKGVDS